MNLYDYTTPTSGESFTTLLEHKNIKIVRIVSSDDIDSTEYIQDEDEWVVVLEGSATLLVDDTEVHLHRGEHLLIPALTPHLVMSVESGTVWVAMHIAEC